MLSSRIAASIAGVAMLAAPAAASPRVVSNPRSVSVLVNKELRLPAGFRPLRLVTPSVPFTFTGFHEKRQLRWDAARALERLFRAARRDVSDSCHRWRTCSSA